MNECDGSECELTLSFIETELMVNDGCPTCKKDVRMDRLTPATFNQGHAEYVSIPFCRVPRSR